MKEIKIEKLVINLCVGESGDKLTKAAKVCYIKRLLKT
jgi:large subunit ribosomal protein L11e